MQMGNGLASDLIILKYCEHLIQVEETGLVVSGTVLFMICNCKIILSLLTLPAVIRTNY